MKARAPRAVYLAIGTELTSGQITNRNASWISRKLESAGIPVSWHLCVPDDRLLMREAMELSARQGELIFVTGGLGPTTDDFTREVIAEWWGGPLEWFEPSWTKLVERLARRGMVPPESNRQQCWYPRGAHVLSNREGTADGFLLEREGCAVFVLPGPPREIEAVWDDHVAAWLESRHGGLRPIEPLTWAVLGRSEAELGDLVEAAVRGSGVTTGYRASPPYVEIKIWIPAGLSRETPAVAAALERLEAAIGPWTVSRGSEDLVELFLGRFDHGPIELVDLATSGLLSERIWNWSRARPENLKRLQALGVSLLTSTGEDVPSKSGTGGYRITLHPMEQTGDPRSKPRFEVTIERTGAKPTRHLLESPYQAFLAERQGRFAVEKLLTLAPPGADG